MKIIAKCPVELHGHIYTKGEACRDYAGPVTPRIAANFTDENGEPLAVGEGNGGASSSARGEPRESGVSKKEKVEKVVSALGRDGILRKLDALNVAYSPKAGTERLAKILLIATGEIED